jgi:serine/threonine-protein kinase
MTPERWAQIKNIFAAVIDQPPGSRTTVLSEMCKDDPELQSQVSDLLSHHEEMGRFLDSAPFPAEADMPALPIELGEVLAGRYKLLEVLGTGGMGEVYEAEDQELGERIALKVIRKQTSLGASTVERLRREVQLARRVTHPNVCRVFDLGYHRQQQQEIIFLTMELIKGETLSARLKRVGRLNPAEALPIAAQLCQALDAAHQAGVLHRDFKCSNVMLLGAGEQVRAVVTDFGIARWMQRKESSASQATTQGMIFGTPAYMSPEQILGENLTASSDIYSLGLVLYEMVTGSRPFHQESSWTEALKRLSETAPPPIKTVPEVGHDWNRTILRCLERDPARRFSSAPQVLQSLQGEGRLPSWVASTRGKVAISTAAFVTLALVSALAVHVWSRRLPAQKHIAVLPFNASGADAADRATAYGLAQSLTANLERLQASDGSMWVVPWSEVRNQKSEDASRAASSLGVNLIVSGELEKKDNKLYLHTALKDAKTLKPLRSENIAVPQEGLVNLEDTLLAHASSMLGLTVPAGMLHHLPSDETAEPGAYEFYAQGRGYLLRFDPDGVDRAITLFEKAIERDANFALAYANIAFAYSLKYRRNGEAVWHQKAKEASSKAIALNDKLASAHTALGSVDQDSGDLDGAIREFEEALRLDPTDDEARNQLSLSYDKSGKMLQAEDLLKGAINRNPASWVNYNDLGYFYYHHSQYPQAERYFRTATELAPDNPKALYNLAGVYLSMQKYNEAEAILEKAVEVKPTYGAYSNLGSVRVYQKRYADAVTMFVKAAELRPGDDRVWRNLGDAYVLEGNSGQASATFQKSLKIAEREAGVRPDDAQVLANLSLYCAKLGQRQRAEHELALAQKKPSTDPEFLYTSALVYELTGQREKALSSLRSTMSAGYPLIEIQSTPDLVRLRADKRYQELARSFSGNKSN